MKLSAPIFRLKKTARALSRRASIPLNQALDRVAQDEGFARWSLLAAHYKLEPVSAKLLDQLSPGDFVLLGGRPQQGKTTLGLALLREAIRKRSPAAYFTLFETEAEARERLCEEGSSLNKTDPEILIDTSDQISAPFIIERMKDARPGTLILIDYLQILDQRRDTPDLDTQVKLLRRFVERTDVIIIVLSQISRRFDQGRKPLPDLSDVHLPNPVDLGAFTQTCFINDGTVQLDRAA